ncbi:MAG: hypothetical protein K2F86_00565, partial [Duncaniella sp.]|nr:hypothetical protein [Duncaniella sp.]
RRECGGLCPPVLAATKLRNFPRISALAAKLLFFKHFAKKRQHYAPQLQKFFYICSAVWPSVP